MISVRNLTKIYKIKGKGGVNNVTALNNVSVDFPDTGLVFLLGKSGSGKSTLLNSIGGLDTFDSGEIIIKGKSSKDFKQSDFDSYRNTFIGFIFQEYNVLEEFTVGKNLSLALELQGKKPDKRFVNLLLDQVDLGGFYKRKPNQLSGGQKQRVAIARALIKNPEIIMADEPTGALDSATGKQVMDTLKKLSQTKLVIIVSHDREFAEIYGDRIIELKDGQIISDTTKTEVMAQKSQSGVSFIDNKIIHIKKGQQISRDDLIKINQMIVHNTHNEDTIISFDNKSNTNVKKSAFITDDGNREVFVNTTREHIRRNPNKSEFKMIKSKLKFKDSFKMGASSLKHKPIRLIFTIILSVIAFGLFGVVNTMSSFNRADSVYATLREFNIKTIGINKRVDYDSYATFPISDSQLAKFQNDNPNYKFNKVVASGEYFYLYGGGNSSSSTEYGIRQRKISGVMEINQDVVEQFDLTLIHGKLPVNDNEVCISRNLLDTLIETYSNVSSFEDLNTTELDIYSTNAGRFKIVGVIKDNTNIDKYKNLSGSQADYYKNELLYSELDTLIKFGLVNMCYVNQTTFNNCLDNYEPNQYRIDYRAYIKGEEYMGGGYGENFNKNINNYYNKYFKNGETIDKLTGNKAIISKGLLTDNIQISESELKSKIDAGLTIHFGAGYNPEKNHAFELEVVGYYDCGGGDITVSEDFYNEYFTGYTCILTQLKGNKDDKSLINYFENNKDKPFNYSIQSISTPVLDQFSEMIESMAKILLWVGVGLAAFAGLMLMNFISVSITYKKREIGVLRAIGARSKDVFSIFFAESFVICMINFVLSCIACVITSNIINSSIVGELGSSLTLMIFGLPQIALLFTVSLGVAFISTFIPVYRFAKKNPIDSINNR
ncbi:MAG: ATP-binding cassette domain-containing protein [Clostridia bacterium]